MDDAVTRQHAHPNTVFHCLYGYYNLGLSKMELANIYNKCERTIGNWVAVYERTGTFERASGNTERKFTTEQKQWLFNYYQTNPLAYLDEAQDAFRRAHRVYISKTSIWRIIHDFGLTWKVLERRAIHVKEADIFRFAEELSFITWSHVNLVFLDEASFDNRGMVRRRGYAVKGKKVAIRGDFQRKPRISTLAFIGANGLIDLFDSEGTFDRVKFMECCELFIRSVSSRVRQYPGPHSVWILDGASIHCDPEIVHYLRSVGVVPIFLPAYCPFFNPIEYMFGYVKRAFQRYYNESSGRDLLPFIIETFGRFKSFDMSRVFEHCGWMAQGHFDPTGPMSSEQRRVPDIWDSTPELDDHDNDLGFTSR